MTNRPRIERSAAQATRRQFFGQSATGIGVAALATLLGSGAASADTPAGSRSGGVPGLPHFAPKAKRVIYLFQNGAPPHLDMFDYKPQMEKFRGQELPE